MGKRWYAVVVGRDDDDYGTGSTRKREALRMAREYAKDPDNDYVAIVLCQTDDDFCEGIITIRDDKAEEAEREDNLAVNHFWNGASWGEAYAMARGEEIGEDY